MLTSEEKSEKIRKLQKKINKAIIEIDDPEKDHNKIFLKVLYLVVKNLEEFQKE